jgi:hypothetical protein
VISLAAVFQGEGSGEGDYAGERRRMKNAKHAMKNEYEDHP